MKKIILLALIAGSISLSSCGKLTKCNCPSGRSQTVNGKDAAAVKYNCEFQTNGVCTY